MAACQLWIRQEWNRLVESPELKTAFDITLDGERAIARNAGIAKGEKLPVPFCVFAFATLQERTAPYHPWLSKTMGIPVGYTANRAQQITEHVKPVDVGLGVRFRSDNLQEAILFSQLWVELQPNVAMDVKNNSTGMVFRINLDLGSQISIPNANTSVPGEPLDVDTTLIVRTYIGTTEMLTTAKKTLVRLTEDTEIERIMSEISVTRNAADFSITHY